MRVSLARGIRSSNGSHRYFEALLPSFIALNRSERPCPLAAIALEPADSGGHLQVDL